jgi:hypothetical protein
MLINVGVLATSCIILPPAPSVLQEGSSDPSDACVWTRGSVRRASGLVQTRLCPLTGANYLIVSPQELVRVRAETRPLDLIDGQASGSLNP